MNSEDKDITIIKTFEHFGEIFEVYIINGWYRKHYWVRHQDSKAEGISGKTIKGAISSTIQKLNELGKDRMFANIHITTQSKKKKRKEDRETIRQNRIKKVLEARMALEKIHWMHTCPVEIILFYKLTLNNGKVLYPSQEDVYQRITKPNREAAQELNPASKYLERVKATWSRDQREYLKAGFQNSSEVPSNHKLL